MERILEGMKSRLADIETVVRESLDNEDDGDWRGISDLDSDDS